MPYVTRDTTGRIIAASPTPLDGASELIAADAPELLVFVEALTGNASELALSDMKLIRAIEDIVDLLISKNIICITDLPPAVQNKLLERRSLRHSLNALNLIGDDDQGLI
jgi:hypothetical protein